MRDHVLLEVRRVIEAAKRLYDEVPDAPRMPLPSAMRGRADAIAVLMVGVCWARQGRPAPIPRLRIGRSTEEKRHRVNTHPFGVLAPLILCPGASSAELEQTEVYVMSEVGGDPPGSKRGNVQDGCRKSVAHWLHRTRQRTHGYTIRPHCNGGWCYCDAWPGGGPVRSG